MGPPPYMPRRRLCRRIHRRRHQPVMASTSFFWLASLIVVCRTSMRRTISATASASSRFACGFLHGEHAALADLHREDAAVLDVAVHGRPQPVAHLDQIGRRVETPHIINHTLGHMKTPTHPARSVPEPAWYRVGVHSVLYVTRTTYRRAAGISEGLSHASRR